MSSWFLGGHVEWSWFGMQTNFSKSEMMAIHCIRKKQKSCRFCIFICRCLLYEIVGVLIYKTGEPHGKFKRTGNYTGLSQTTFPPVFDRDADL